MGGAGGAAAKALNPDISVIGDFVGAAGNRAEPRHALARNARKRSRLPGSHRPLCARRFLHHASASTGVDLEEGYLTFTSLPAGLQLKVGKMRAAFGKVNTLHNHVLPWTDRPLVTQNLVGGEDGIDDAGLSLSRILPAPKGIFLEGTAQVFRGDSDGRFPAAQAQRCLDGRPSARLPRHHRVHQYRSRRLLRARPQPVRRRLESALRRRRHAALEAAAPRDLPLFRRRAANSSGRDTVRPTVGPLSFPTRAR